MDDEFEYHVRHRAYELWVQAGRPDGKHQDFWEAAERELKSKTKAQLNGLAVRVPLLNASLTDCVFEVARASSVEEVNGLLAEAALRSLAGILGYEERPLVSVDYKDDPRSAIVDAPSTTVVDETHVKILAWYDNEWGYANRLIDLARIAGSSLPAAAGR